MMKVRSAEFDLHSPRDIWGLETYNMLEVLIRDGDIPTGRLRIPLDRGAKVLTAQELQELAKEQSMVEHAGPETNASSSEPGISVVVCTRDRPIALRRCLESLKRLTYTDFEVIIVDNASQGNETKELVLSTHFRYVREDEPGLDWARNRGLREATREILAYTDDDVQVDSGWLRGIARGFSNQGVACVTGLVCPLELEYPAQRVFEQYGGMGKGYRPRLFDPSKMSPQSLIEVHSTGVGANMAFRRDVLTALEGFDVHLDVGTPSDGGGDLNMFHRILVSGHSIYYEPTALVWHQHRRSMSGLRRQIRNNGRAFGCCLLTIAKRQSVPRSEVAHYALRRWIGGWLLGSLLPGGPASSPALVGVELWGALQSPVAYWKTYRR